MDEFAKNIKECPDSLTDHNGSFRLDDMGSIKLKKARTLQ